MKNYLEVSQHDRGMWSLKKKENHADLKFDEMSGR